MALIVSIAEDSDLVSSAWEKRLHIFPFCISFQPLLTERRIQKRSSLFR